MLGSWWEVTTSDFSTSVRAYNSEVESLLLPVMVTVSYRLMVMLLQCGVCLAISVFAFLEDDPHVKKADRLAEEKGLTDASRG